VLPVVDGRPNVPDNADISVMWHALGELWPSIVAFFIGFIVIGRYWIAHHSFYGMLAKVDRRFLMLSFVYLAVIAFLPFPTFLVGHYESNPLSVITYASRLFVASAMEIELFRHAHRHDLLTTRLSEPVYRFGVLESMSPLFAFAFAFAFAIAIAIAIPVAFRNSSAGLYCFLLGAPIAILIDRRQPAEVAAFEAAGGTAGPE
jgi:uncharacterized membrane protein